MFTMKTFFELVALLTLDHVLKDSQSQKRVALFEVEVHVISFEGIKEEMRKFPENLTLASFNSPFFTFPELTHQEKHGGIFGRFLVLHSQTLHFEYTVVSTQDETFGSYIKRGNITVVYEMLKRGKADFGLVYATSISSLEVDMTVPFSDMSITFATELPRNLPKAYAYVYPFDVATWTGVFVVLMLVPAIFYWVSIKKGASLVRLYLNAFGDVLHQSWPSLAGVSGSMKHLLVNWWFFAFVVSSSYSGTLLSFLTLPRYETPITDFKALSAAVKRGEYEAFYKYGTTLLEECRFTGRQELIDVADAVEKNGWFIYDGVAFDFSSRKKKSAHVTLRILLYLMHGKPPLASKFISADDAYSVPTSMPVSKMFCCKEALDVAIRRIRYAGLFEKCVDDELFMWWVRSEKNGDSQSVDEPLTVNDLSGAFFILGIGYTLSLLVLFIEMSTKRKKNIS